jgi:hypothetical protein
VIVLALAAAIFGLGRLDRQPVHRPPLAERGRLKSEILRQTDQAASPEADGRLDAGNPFNGLAAVPRIAHAAELAVATREFARSRAALEEILERHRGYAARLRMIGEPDGSVLSATLRIPSSEFESAVNDLKSLGKVEREEQTADEVTEQRADLEARLANARSSLGRLEELLKKQTYPDGNVRELERQIAAGREEIHRLEAEKLASDRRTLFANVLFSLKEEAGAPQGLAAQLRNAAASGFGEAAASLAALLVLVVGRGPFFLLWIAILYLPARALWRRWPRQDRPQEA